MKKQNTFTTMKIILLFIVISMFLISCVSALDYTIQINNKNTNYAVILNEYDVYIYSEFNATLNFEDNFYLYGDYGLVKLYKWTPNNQAGERIFTANDESFHFNVISKYDEFFNQIEDYTIFLGQDNSYVEISNFNLFNTSMEMLYIDYDNYNANINLANFIRGLNANLTFYEGESYPIVNSFVLNSSTAITFIEFMLISEGHTFTVDDFNAHPQYYFDYLIDYYNLTTTYSRTVNAIKNGDYMKLSVNEGYSIIQENDLENQVREFIEEKIVYLNPFKINDEIFSFTGENMSYYLEMGGYSLSDLNFTIDFNNLELTDGTYTLNLIYLDNYNNSGQKEFNVTLDISNIETQTIENNTFTPTTPEVLEVIQEINGLPNNSTITLTLYGNELPSNFVEPVLNVTSISYIEINLSVNQTGNYKINFTISDSYNKSRINAYVYENNWVLLPTYYLETKSGKHYFYFETTHFSNFLISEEIIIVLVETNADSSSGGSSSSSYYPVIKPKIEKPNESIVETPIIDLTPDKIDEVIPDKKNKLKIIIGGLIILFCVILFFVALSIIKRRKKKLNEKI